MGWRITTGNAQVIPVNAGAWVVADGESRRWELENLPDGGNWQITGYNLGNQPHSIWIEWTLAYITPTHAHGGPLTAAQLAPVPDLSSAGPPVRRRH